MAHSLRRRLHQASRGAADDRGLFGRLGACFSSGLSCGGFFVLHPNEAMVFTFVGRYFGSVRTAGSLDQPVLRQAPGDAPRLNLVSRRSKSTTPAATRSRSPPSSSGTSSTPPRPDSTSTTTRTSSPFRARRRSGSWPATTHTTPTTRTRSRSGPTPTRSRPSCASRSRNVSRFSGVNVVEARLMHLAYAPEIAQVMLRRQQAEAIIAARQKIVDGAVGMVDMALKGLENAGVVHLDQDKKAAMVNNLLVALVSESETTPIINTGTLYTLIDPCRKKEIPSAARRRSLRSPGKMGGRRSAQRQRRDGISAEGGGRKAGRLRFIKRRPARPRGTINAKRRADRERSPGRT